MYDTRYQTITVYTDFGHEHEPWTLTRVTE